MKEVRKTLLAFTLTALFSAWLLLQGRQHPTQTPEPSPLYRDSLVESLSDLDIMTPKKMKAWEHLSSRLFAKP